MNPPFSTPGARRLLYAFLATVVAGLVALSPMAGRATRTAASAHWEFGRGPTIVLVHGLGSGIDHWMPVARRLARDHRVVLVELPGHGLSEMAHPLTLDAAAASLDAAIEEVTSRPVVLVGHSVGGLVAARLALMKPERVRSLVLIETTLKPGLDAKERQALRAALDRDWDGTLRDVWMSFGRDSAQGIRLFADVERMDHATIRSWIDLALEADLSGAAAALDIPVTAVFATRNWERGIPWRTAAAPLGYAGVLQVRPLRFEDCGHFVMLDRPLAVARAIEEAAKPVPLAGNIH